MKIRSVIIVGAVTLGHAALSFALLVASFGASMGRFDTGETATAGQRILDRVAEVLLWPLFAPLAQWGGPTVEALLPGVIGYIPLVLNSLLWALAIVFVWQRLLPSRTTGA